MKKEKLTLYCDQSQLTDIRRRAAGQGLSISAYVCKLVSNELSPDSDPLLSRFSILEKQNKSIAGSLQDLLSRLSPQKISKVQPRIEPVSDELTVPSQSRLDL